MKKLSLLEPKNLREFLLLDLKHLEESVSKLEADYSDFDAESFYILIEKVRNAVQTEELSQADYIFLISEVHHVEFRKHRKLFWIITDKLLDHISELENRVRELEQGRAL